MVVKLFGEIGPRYAARNGGYLRILKYGFRKGDNAPMALIETAGPSGRRRSAGDRGVLIVMEMKSRLAGFFVCGFGLQLPC